MPIDSSFEFKVLPEVEFRELDYLVTGCAFAAQNNLGNLFREEVYQAELSARLNALGVEVAQEVGVNLNFGTFRRRYCCDLIVQQGVIYETKAVSRLVGKHQEQVLHYLFLTGLRNGKLLNFKPDSLESKFVTTHWSEQERRAIECCVEEWKGVPDVPDFLEVCEAVLQDWGAGLMGAVYKECIISQIKALSLQESQMKTDSGVSHRVRFPVLPDGSIFHFSTLRNKQGSYERNIRKWFSSLNVPTIQWLNLNGTKLECKTLIP
jgi:GxxExxY protein